MSKGSILLIIPCSDFLFVVDPVFNHFESKQEKKKTKGSETPVSSGDCLDPSDLHADFFFSTWVRASESSGILAFPCFCFGFFPHKSTEINSIDLVGMIFFSWVLALQNWCSQPKLMFVQPFGLAKYLSTKWARLSSPFWRANNMVSLQKSSWSLDTWKSATTRQLPYKSRWPKPFS